LNQSLLCGFCPLGLMTDEAVKTEPRYPTSAEARAGAPKRAAVITRPTVAFTNRTVTQSTGAVEKHTSYVGLLTSQIGQTCSACRPNVYPATRKLDEAREVCPRSPARGVTSSTGAGLKIAVAIFILTTGRARPRQLSRKSVKRRRRGLPSERVRTSM
jgi:hypothetical protein